MASVGPSSRRCSGLSVGERSLLSCLVTCTSFDSTASLSNNAGVLKKSEVLPGLLHHTILFFLLAVKP